MAIATTTGRMRRVRNLLAILVHYEYQLKYVDVKGWLVVRTQMTADGEVVVEVAVVIVMNQVMIETYPRLQLNRRSYEEVINVMEQEGDRSFDVREHPRMKIFYPRPAASAVVKGGYLPRNPTWSDCARKEAQKDPPSTPYL
jgi:hypothetical protein